MRENTDIVRVQNLHTYFFRDGSFIRAVDGVSFSIPQYGRIGLAGESGSGKTQTVLSVMGLVDGIPGIVDGEVWINGRNTLEGLDRHCVLNRENGKVSIEKDVSGWREAHNGYMEDVRGGVISMMFQEPKTALSPYFTVGEQFCETAVARFGKEVQKSYRLHALKLFNRMQFKNKNIGHILNRYPHELSGGESQRVMLALALVGEPQLLIADEPTTQLDALTQYRVLELIEEIVEERQLAFLLISHDLAVLARMVDYVIIMFSGRVVEQGPVRQIADRDITVRHPYTQLLLEAATFRDRPDVISVSEMHTESNLQGCRYYYRCPLKDQLDEEGGRRCLHEVPPQVEVGDSHTISCWEMETHAS